MILESVVTCPHCATQKSEAMPSDACLVSYECTGCGAKLQPREEMIVACSARTGSVACPPIQAEAPIRAVPLLCAALAISRAGCGMTDALSGFARALGRRVSGNLNRCTCPEMKGRPSEEYDVGRVRQFKIRPMINFHAATPHLGIAGSNDRRAAARGGEELGSRRYADGGAALWPPGALLHRRCYPFGPKFGSAPDMRVTQRSD